MDELPPIRYIHYGFDQIYWEEEQMIPQRHNEPYTLWPVEDASIFFII